MVLCRDTTASTLENVESTLSPRISELLSFTKTHQRHAKALARATGQHFNIFKILRIGHLEVKTHSPILGALLDPKGSHEQGATFLRLFLSKFGITEGKFNAKSPATTMKLEYDCGEVGRIDIMLDDGVGSKIFIENKIYAPEGEDQIKNYLRREPKAMFYLTLRKGGKPSGLSEGELELV